LNVEALTRRHIQAVRLMLPKIPDRALVKGRVCAAAWTASVATGYMIAIGFRPLEGVSKKKKRHQRVDLRD
jgi:hypothetical protein